MLTEFSASHSLRPICSWVMANALHIRFFLQQLFANRIGGFFGMDVLVAAVLLIFFVGEKDRGWVCLIGGCQMPEY